MRKYTQNYLHARANCVTNVKTTETNRCLYLQSSSSNGRTHAEADDNTCDKLCLTGKRTSNNK